MDDETREIKSRIIKSAIEAKCPASGRVVEECSVEDCKFDFIGVTIADYGKHLIEEHDHFARAHPDTVLEAVYDASLQQTTPMNNN